MGFYKKDIYPITLFTNYRNPGSTKRFPWRIPYSPYRAKVSTGVLCTKKTPIQPRSAGTRLCVSEKDYANGFVRVSGIDAF